MSGLPSPSMSATATPQSSVSHANQSRTGTKPPATVNSPRRRVSWPSSTVSEALSRVFDYSNIRSAPQRHALPIGSVADYAELLGDLDRSGAASGVAGV